jgi:tetratricopeptide (TPR) repeat protein
VFDSIACSYTEQGNVSDALEYLSKSSDIHRAHNPHHMARTQAIYAMTYLRAERPDEAMEALETCWRLQNLTEEQITQSRYPKHSGDIVLLSKIKYAQGLREEAQQLASRTISIRKGLFGDKGPRVADSMFIVARMLEADGEDVIAAKLLRTVVEISRGLSEMHGHLARSLWFLAEVESKMGNNNLADQLKAEAVNERDLIDGREAAEEDTDESFMNLVGWMLW